MLAFHSGHPAPSPRPLARFLPPLAEGVAAHYIEHYTQPGDLIFDPFGQSPRVVLEALHLNRRVLVANFNPVSRLNLSLALRPPAETDLRAALTFLADAPKDNQRLEDYLLGFYRTTCVHCQRPVIADTFEWEGDDLLTKTYHCDHCHQDFIQIPADPADRELAHHFRRGLDYYLLLDRVAALESTGGSQTRPDIRAHAEEALAVYPHRTLAAIAAVLIKLDTLHPPPETRRLLAGLLIVALDATTALTQDRPRILTSPKRYHEHNFWRALEKALGMLAGNPAPNCAVALPELLTSADGAWVHAHAGPARDLAGSLPAGCVSLLLTAVPRPNQAYWTLSALWAAWLWGRDSAAALRSVLLRRRYDWSWHATALQHTLASVRPALQPGGRLIALMAESEPGFNASLLLATAHAGYSLASAALRADTAEAQFIFGTTEASPRAEKPDFSASLVQEAAREAAITALLMRGEPARWLIVHLAAWRGLAEHQLITFPTTDPLPALNHLLDPVFRDAQHFSRWGAEQDDDPATGLWYVAPETALTARPSLADRLEARLLHLLADGEPHPAEELIRQLQADFPGLSTPDHNLIEACLTSYAHSLAPGLWQMRPEDASVARAEELHAIQAQLRALGVRQGYTLAGANPLEWREAEQVVYTFALLTTAIISYPVFAEQPPAQRRFLALPGGRAGLAAFKLRRDPRLRAAVGAGNWVILKFRHIRRMAADSALTRATLEPAFYADPLDEAKQLLLMTQAE